MSYFDIYPRAFLAGDSNVEVDDEEKCRYAHIKGNSMNPVEAPYLQNIHTR